MPYKSPDIANAYQREYRRLQRSGECTTPRTTQLPADFRLRTAHDVIALLEGQVSAVLADESIATTERARTVGYLATVSLRAIEAGDLTARLESLEAALRERKKP